MWKLFFLIGALGAGFLGGWRVHSWKVGAAEVKTIEKVVYVTRESGKIAEKAATADAQAQERIRWETRYVLEKVPIYVTDETDRALPLPGGFVRVLDAAILGVEPSALDAAAYGPDDAPSPIAPSFAAETLVGNEKSCQADRARLAELQGFVEAMNILAERNP